MKGRKQMGEDHSYILPKRGILQSQEAASPSDWKWQMPQQSPVQNWGVGMGSSVVHWEQPHGSAPTSSLTTPSPQPP